MIIQRIYKSSFVEKLKVNVKNSVDLEKYFEDISPFTDEETYVNPEIEVPKEIRLHLPGSRNDFEFENSKIIFEAYKNLNPTKATDIRLWTYLTHRTFWQYMRKRRPVEQQPKEKLPDYILNHWFINSLSTSNLLRNDISLLWWCSYMTYDKNRKDPYELTSEVFTMLDYTRHLLPGFQGRHNTFLRSLLEFVIENKGIFQEHKEGKVRLLMRKSNYIAGYRIIPTYTGAELKSLFASFIPEIRTVTGR